MIYKKGDVVVLPFPFTDKSSAKRRPALVLSQNRFNTDTQQSIFAMITSAKNSSWASDIAITDTPSAGLNNDSIVRLKIFTLENQFIIRCIGALCNKDLAAVNQELNKVILVD